MRPVMRCMIALFLVLSFAIVVSQACVFAEEAKEATLQKLNINTASVDELTQLKGIGPAYAQAIIEYRKTHGLFQTVDDLMKVKGIGSKTFEAVKDNITIK